jgi:glycosidase
MKNENKPLARKSPDWLKRSVMYQVYLRAFTPEGTLKAATQKLPELAELGVDIVYLCPIFLQDDDMRQEFWSPRQIASGCNNPKNPYRIKDYYSIDPEYGTEDDLRDFVRVAHSLNLRVLLDIVFLHCGPTAVFIDEHPDFVKRDAEGNIQYASWGFPAINFESSALREYLWKNMDYWMRDFDVDGYRCDVSDAVELDFWETARTRLEALKSEVIMLAEGHREEDQLAAFDMNYNFPGAFSIHRVFNQGKPASSVRELQETQAAKYPAGFRFIRYVDNHDIANDRTCGVKRTPGQSEESWQSRVTYQGVPQEGLPPDSRMEKAWGSQAVDAVLALCFAMDGVPLLYNGQEVADAAPHSIYANWPIDWANGDTPTGQARRALCQRLCELRHSESALGEGALTWLDNQAPDSLLSFTRNLAAEQILVLVNLSDRKVESPLDLLATAAFQVLLANGASLAEGSATLAPFGYFIGKTQQS